MDLILIILILKVTTHGAVQINLSDGLRHRDVHARRGFTCDRLCP
jgi:hypothetical protein